MISPEFDRTEGGFTLIEILVALVIFAIGFGALASIFQTSLRQSTLAETLMAATAVAERQMARFGADLPLRPGETTGLSSEGLSWKALIDLASPVGEEADIALYRITLHVGTEEEEIRYLTLETLRIGKAP